MKAEYVISRCSITSKFTLMVPLISPTYMSLTLRRKFCM